MSIIEIKHISKIYNLYKSPADRVKEALHPFNKKFHKDFFALKDITFDVNKGDVLGIIGKNGAGKSTLLKILTGVLTPTSGSYTINGRISALLELGGGINPEYTGIENIYFNGSILGLTKEQIDAKIQEIIDFAEIGDFINIPVKTYSSGMAVRLAFAIAINIDPDILIVDEALSVGDMRFQQKSLRRMRKLMEKAKAIIFVTHDIGMVLNFCNKVIWLKDGEIFKSGEPEEICKQYLSYMAYEDIGTEKVDSEASGIPSKINNQSWINTDKFESFGERGACIEKVSFYNTEHQNPILNGNEHVDLLMHVKVFENIHDPIIGFIIKDRLGNNITGMNTFVNDIKIGELNIGTYNFKINFKLPNICNGVYTISPALAEGAMLSHIQHHWVHDVIQFNVNNSDIRYTIGLNHILDNVDFEIIEE